MAERLPEGVALRSLARHADPRGVLSEFYRAEQVAGDPMVQWNIVRSEGGVLRGVHVHPGHADYLFVIEGTMILGLHDLRPDRPEDRRSALVTLRGDAPQTVCVPQGVCHGFHFPEPAIYVYGLSGYWSMDEELGCRYDAPELGLPWAAANPVLSARDADAGGYAEMREAYFATLAQRAPAA